MSDNVVENKSFDFAVRIVNLHKHLSSEEKRVCSFEAIATKRNEYRSECFRSSQMTKQSGFLS